jgi:hypothetical protein
MAKPERRNNISCAPVPTVGLSAAGSTVGCCHDALLGRSCAPVPMVRLPAPMGGGMPPWVTAAALSPPLCAWALSAEQHLEQPLGRAQM